MFVLMEPIACSTKGDTAERMISTAILFSLGFLSLFNLLFVFLFFPCGVHKQTKANKSTVQKFKKNATSSDLCFSPLSSRLDTKKREQERIISSSTKVKMKVNRQKFSLFLSKSDTKKITREQQLLQHEGASESEVHTSNYKGKAAGMFDR